MWRSRLRNLLAFATVAIVILAPAFSFPVLVGLVAVDVVSRARLRDEMRRGSRDVAEGEGENPRQRRRERRREQERVLQARRDRAVEYDERRGWDVNQLPFDMKATRLSSPSMGAVSRFECAGIPGLVHARAQGKDVEYSFVLDDAGKAEAVQREAKMHNGAARVERDGDSFVVKAYNAATINDLAKKAFPPSRHEVQREFVHTRQYVVSGQRSYADALKELRNNHDLYSPVNSFTSVADTVDGVRRVSSNGGPFSPGLLRPGEWVVTEEEVSRYAGQVEVPGNVRIDEDIIECARDRFVADDASRVTLSDTERVRMSDGTPENVGRYVRMDDGSSLRLYSQDDPAISSLHAYLVCEDVDSMAEVLNQDGIPKGSYLVLDSEAPAKDGCFVIELDMDDEVRSLLAVQGDASPAFAARCESMGVTKETLEASLLMDAVSRRGYAEVRLRDSVAFDKVRVNGVPVNDLAERLGDERLPALDRKAAADWIRDAALIQSVNITIDAKKAEMRITSCVGDVQKVETRKMTDKEIRDFSRRGEISKAEMKDLLMQVHPDFFRSYSHGGKSVFEDPVRDFIAGQKPKLSPTLGQQMQQAQAKGPKPEKKRSTGPKIG